MKQYEPFSGDEEKRRKQTGLFPQQIIRDIQLDQQEVSRLRQEIQRVQSLRDDFLKKEAEMQRLIAENLELQKYKGSYEKYEKLKSMLDEIITKGQDKSKQNKQLFMELQKAINEIDSLQKKLTESDRTRLQLVKERVAIDRLNKDIQETFRQYKKECKQKEKELTDKLENAYRQIKEDRKLLQQVEELRRHNHSLKQKVEALQSELHDNKMQKLHLEELIQTKEHDIAGLRVEVSKFEDMAKQNSRFRETQDYRLGSEVEELQKKLAARERELQKSKALSHELSIEFDRSVARIGEFQRELSEYRRENHELKKTLTMLIEKEDYQRLHHRRPAINSMNPDGSFLDNDPNPDSERNEPTFQDRKDSEDQNSY